MAESAQVVNSVQNNWKVTVAAATGLGGPDAIAAFFDQIGPILEGLVRLGQIGVAFFTCLYIYGKWREKRKKKSRKSGRKTSV